tara:strand:- start:863 stop:1081 length:219 start_codon:yes stop_codon:yes gene_type:complete
MKRLLFLLRTYLDRIFGRGNEADSAKGMRGYDSGDYATALAKWIPLGEKGDMDAQVNLGVMYENGKSVPEGD